MEFVWAVNILVALLSFSLWRKTPAIMDTGYTSDSEATKKTTDAIFTVLITLFCLTILPVFISAMASYALLMLSGQPLNSFSVLAFYVPHGLVLTWFISRTFKASDWNFTL